MRACCYHFLRPSILGGTGAESHGSLRPPAGSLLQFTEGFIVLAANIGMKLSDAFTYMYV